MGRRIQLLLAALTPLSLAYPVASARAASLPAERGVYMISEDGSIRPAPGIARPVGKSSAGPRDLPGALSVVEPDSIFRIFSHEFENVESDDCDARGWTAEERADLVFVHVDDEFLQNDAVISMGTKALWFGCDLTSHPSEVAKWFSPYGFGFAWSQRATSPVLSSVGNYRLEFVGRIGLDVAATPIAAAPTSGSALVHRFLTVQASQPGGGTPWINLPARWNPIIAPQITTSTGIRGNGSFRCYVPLHADSVGVALGSIHGRPRLPPRPGYLREHRHADSCHR